MSPLGRRRCAVIATSVVLASASASAQTAFGGALAPRSASQAPDPETSREVAPARVEHVERAVMRDPADPQRGARIALSAITGLTSGALLGAGLAAGLALAAQRGTSRTETAFAVGGGALGWSLGLPLGVVLVGNALGGQGGYGWSVLGGVVGSLPGLGVLLLTGGQRPWLGVWTGVLLGVTGAVVGYELSSSSRARRATSGIPRALPDVAVSSQGVTLGLAGAF